MTRRLQKLRLRNHSGYFILNFLLSIVLAASSTYLVAQARVTPQESSSSPYPPSPVILNIAWAPVDEIQRRASGSDNFPITWADDDLLYTSFGDGFGFRPFGDEKLSMGFAAVSGNGADFTGVNIASDYDQIGHGRTGLKASSMLMVGGVLYMWMRNADGNGRECQLAWSTDKAVSCTSSLSVTDVLGNGVGGCEGFN